MKRFVQCGNPVTAAGLCAFQGCGGRGERKGLDDRRSGREAKGVGAVEDIARASGVYRAHRECGLMAGLTVLAPRYAFTAFRDRCDPAAIGLDLCQRLWRVAGIYLECPFGKDGMI